MLSEYQKFFTARPTPQIAKDLLGRLLVFHGRKGDVGGWIVETEAYVGEQDSASHAFGDGELTIQSRSMACLVIFIFIRFARITVSIL